jgi:hypothetical protein
MHDEYPRPWHIETPEENGTSRHEIVDASGGMVICIRAANRAEIDVLRLIVERVNYGDDVQ